MPLEREFNSGQGVVVAIVGGGPVGMTAGLLLAQLGIASVILERRSGTSRHPKARGFNVRTMEIFRQLGLNARVAAGQPPKERVRSFAIGQSLADPGLRTLPFGIGDLDPTPYSPCTGSVGSQDALETVLHHAVSASPHVTMINNAEVVDVRQGDTGATVDFVDASGHRHSVDAKWVIAADGARSAIRQRAGIKLTGEAGISRHINVMFEAELAGRMDDLASVFVITGPRGDALSGIPTARHPNEWTFNFVLAPDERIEHFDADACAGRIRAALGYDDVPIRVTGIAPWESSAVVAERWRDGRIFLAGDAAHLMPPAGGLGMNTGIQDVHNLAWRIAFVEAGVAGVGLLDDYVDERMDAAWLSVRTAAANLKAARAAGGPSVLWSHPQHGIALGQRLLRGTLIAEDAGQDRGPGDPTEYRPVGTPGVRAPHVYLDTGANRSTLDLFGNRFVLVCGGDGSAWQRAALALLRTTGLAIDVAALDEPACADAAATWRNVTAIGTDGALLVRPDGLIAWRAKTGAEAAALPEVTRTLLHRTLRLDPARF